MKKTSRGRKSRPVRQNRLGFRKKVIGHRPSGHKYQKPIKIKGKDWEKVQ